MRARVRLHRCSPSSTQIAIAARCRTYGAVQYAVMSVRLVFVCVAIAGALLALLSGARATAAGWWSQPLAPSDMCLTPSGVVVRPTDGALIVACEGGGILLVNGSDAVPVLLVAPGACPAPRSVVVASNGAVLAACGRNGSVIQVTDSLLTRLTTASQCPEAKGVALWPGERAAIAVCDGRSDGVVLLKTSISNDSFATPLVTSVQCPDPGNVALDGDGALVVACGLGGVLVVPLAPGTAFVLLNGSTCNAAAVTIRLSNGTLLAACRGRGVVGFQLRNVSALETVLSSTFCAAVSDVAVGPSPFVVVACGAGGSVVLASVSTSPLSIVAGDPVLCPDPRGVAVRPTDGAIFATCGAGGSVLKVNRPPTGVPFPCSDARGVVRSSDGAVFAACSDGIYQVPVATAIVSTGQCSQPRGLALRPSDGALIAACYGGGVIQVVNGSVALLANATQCQAVAIRANDSAVFAACGDRVIQISQGGVTTLVDRYGKCVPLDITVRPHDGAVIAACANPREMYIRNTSVVQIFNGSVVTLIESDQCTMVSSVAILPSNGAVIAACRGYGPSFGVGRVVMLFNSTLLMLAPCAGASLVATLPDGNGDAIVAVCSQVGVLIMIRNLDTSWTSVRVFRLLGPGGVCATPKAFATARSLLSVACRDTALTLDLSCGGLSGYSVMGGLCIACPFGSAKPAGGLACEACRPGYTHHRSAPFAVCEPVPLGSYDPGLTPRLTAFPCAPGTFANSTASTRCAACGAGRFSGAGSSACSECSAGQTALDGMPSCLACEPVRCMNTCARAGDSVERVVLLLLRVACQMPAAPPSAPPALPGVSQRRRDCLAAPHALRDSMRLQTAPLHASPVVL